MDLSVTLAELRLANPIIAASGTFGFGAEAAKLYDINILGGVSAKGLTLEPRLGNAQPRIAESASGLINSIGLENPGANHAAAHELPWLRANYRGTIIANVCGFSVDEYREVARIVEPLVDALEVNISCPNVHSGGMSFGVTVDGAASVTRAVRSVTAKPIIMKLSPNVTDIVSIAKTCEDAGADALTLINTISAMRIDVRNRRPLLGNVTGGLSGPAVFPVAIRAIWQAYKAVRIPIVGSGGASCANDVIEMMMAGAVAVEVGSAGLVNPWAYSEVIGGLDGALRDAGASCAMEIVGAAHGDGR